MKTTCVPWAQLRKHVIWGKLWTHLGHFDGRILGNDSCPTAWGVQKHTVKAIHDLKTQALIHTANTLKRKILIK